MSVHVDFIHRNSLNTVNVIPEDPYNTELERPMLLNLH